MSEIIFSCECGMILKVNDDDQAGNKVTCPSCNTTVRVPSVGKKPIAPPVIETESRLEPEPEPSSGHQGFGIVYVCVALLLTLGAVGFFLIPALSESKNKPPDRTVVSDSTKVTPPKKKTKTKTPSPKKSPKPAKSDSDPAPKRISFRKSPRKRPPSLPRNLPSWFPIRPLRRLSPGTRARRRMTRCSHHPALPWPRRSPLRPRRLRPRRLRRLVIRTTPPHQGPRSQNVPQIRSPECQEGRFGEMPPAIHQACREAIEQ